MGASAAADGDGQALPSKLDQLVSAMNQLVAGLSEDARLDDPLVIQPGQIWVTADQLARRYGVTRKWVAARTRELGAAPISDSPNSKLRYRLPTADAYMDGRMRERPPRAKPIRSPYDTRKTSANTSARVEFV